MRELTELLVATSAKAEIRDAIVLVNNGAGLTKFGEGMVVPQLLLLDVAHNNLSDIKGLFHKFPMVWWANLGFNPVNSLDFDTLPLGLGLLDISSQPPVNTNLLLAKIKNVHILRLCVDGSPTYRHEDTNDTLQQLPLIWVLNDDYIPLKIVKAASMAAPGGAVELGPASDGSWGGLGRGHDREASLLWASRELPCSSEIGDRARLDVLLEDYLDEVSYFNKYYCMANQLPRRRLPRVDCQRLLHMGHAARLDLSAVLTLSIVMDIPVSIFLDGLEERLGPYFSREQLKDILVLPLFAKTAIVSIIRRICRKELEEYSCLRLILNKAVLPEYRLDVTPVDFESAPSFQGPMGFRHLRTVRHYCELFDPTSIASGRSSVIAELASAEGPYSELELEILKILPDVPTRTTSMRDDGDCGAYSSWVSLAARHSVVLLSRSKRCPSLTKAQTSKAMQDAYAKLLPVLRLAKMSYADMDIASTGPRSDGRVGVRAEASGPSRVLDYGEGLPRGSLQLLSWNKMPPISIYNFNNVTTAENSPPVDGSLVKQSSHESVAASMNDDMSSFDDSRVCSIMSQSRSNATRLQQDTSRGAGGSNHGRRAASSPARSPSREPVPLRSAGVLGFSADVVWSSSFLLASERAIQAHNETIAETDGWRPLAKPPLVVQSPVRFVSSDGFHQAPADSCGENVSGSCTDEQVDARIAVQSQGNHFSFVDGGMNQLSAVIEGSELEGSSADHTNPVGQLSVLSSYSPLGPKADAFAQRMERELMCDLGIEELQQNSPNNTIRKVTRGREFGTSSAQDKVRSLMKEMGSLRNTREMAEYNDFMAMQALEQKRSAQMRRSKQSSALKKIAPLSYQPNCSVSTYGSAGGSFNSPALAKWKPMTVSMSLDNVSWMKQLGEEGKKFVDEAVEQRVEAFLTGLQEHMSGEFETAPNDRAGSALDDSSVEASITSRATTGNNNVQGSGILEEYNSAIMMPFSGSLPVSSSRNSSSGMLTVTDALRNKYQYPHIYENNANIEWGALAPGGKQLQPNWYPCPSKVVMRLKESAALLAPVKGPESPVTQAPHIVKLKAAVPASIFRPSGLLSEPEAARRFTAKRAALIVDGYQPVYVNTPKSSSVVKASSERPPSQQLPAEPTTVPSSRIVYPEFEVTGATPRPISRGHVSQLPQKYVTVSSARRESEVTEGSGSRTDYSKKQSNLVLYVDDVFPEDLSATASQICELRNRFAEELIASLPPSSGPPSPTNNKKLQTVPQKSVTPVGNQGLLGASLSRDQHDAASSATHLTDDIQSIGVSSRKTSITASRDHFNVDPVQPPRPGKDKKAARGGIGLEPHFRGVEGHKSGLTHGQPSVGLSVLKPVTKTIVLNRSFKVTVKQRHSADLEA